MSARFIRLFGCLVVATLAASAAAAALQPGDRVPNFRLLDHAGKSHELYYLSDKRAVVLLAHKNDCDDLEEIAPALNALQQQFNDQRVEVLLINSTAGDSRELVAADVAKIGVNAPALLDRTQLIGESLGLKRAGEALVIDPRDWTVKYRGPLKKAGIDLVGDALTSMLANEPVVKPTARANGCKIKLPELNKQRAHAKISYVNTIAPMLADKCVNCHRAGGIGPWHMSSYEMIRGFAPMIREVLLTERMPPWHADPHFSAFSNNRALSNEQVKTLVHWINAGAPRDKGIDPLAQQPKVASQWALGEPDLIVEIPAFAVPATGAIPYQRPVVKNPLGRDVWLRAIEFAPTNRGVVHHILAGTTGGRGDALARLEATTSLGVYVPGDVPHDVPKGTGVFIPKEADFVFQMHYTANGKAVSEVTKVGLYFSKEVPQYPLHNTVLLDPRLKIPPHVKDHQASVSRVFTRDVLIYTLMAHSHVRGKSAQFVATYPDGKTETLLAVPHYDFNWQTSYELTTPKLLPKGTRLVYYSSYDNSSQNKANPDPSIEVRWGEQTWEEMIYGDVRFRYVDEVATEKTADTLAP